MAQKVYLIVVKGDNKVSMGFDAYESFEKAEKHIYETAKKFPDRKVKKSEVMRNEFDVYDIDLNYLHTLEIIDGWLR